MWILGSFSLELGLMFMPALLGIVVSLFYPDLSETSLLYTLFATALVDSGHVYTTAWRTWLNPSEIRCDRRYWLIPLLCFVVFSLWYYFQTPGLWPFVVYATIFHHIRQAYGFSRWYQALNKRSDRVSDYFLYALMILPFVAFHFRDDAHNINYYSQSDLFIFPDITALTVITLVYLCVLFSWAFYERTLWKKRVKEPNRLLSVAFPAFVYGYCFLYGKTLAQVLFPLLFMHGIAYCAVMAQTLNKTQGHRFKTILQSAFVIILTAIVFGLGESWYEENMAMESHLLTACAVALTLTPLFSHYIFDAWIWKRSHRDSQAILEVAK